MFETTAWVNQYPKVLPSNDRSYPPNVLITCNLFIKMSNYLFFHLKSFKLHNSNRIYPLIFYWTLLIHIFHPKNIDLSILFPLSLISELLCKERQHKKIHLVLDVNLITMPIWSMKRRHSMRDVISSQYFLQSFACIKLE